MKGLERLRSSGFHAMPPERAFEHIQFGAQKVNLGPQVILHRDAGYDGEMRQTVAAPGANEEGLHAFVQDFGRDRHPHRVFTGTPGD